MKKLFTLAAISLAASVSLSISVSANAQATSEVFTVEKPAPDNRLQTVIISQPLAAEPKEMQPFAVIEPVALRSESIGDDRVPQDPPAVPAVIIPAASSAPVASQRKVAKLHSFRGLRRFLLASSVSKSNDVVLASIGPDDLRPTDA